MTIGQRNNQSGVPVYDSVRRGQAAWEELLEVWHYRDLVYQLARRDIVARYKRSVLGVAWTMLNPLGMMIVLTIVFSQVFRAVEGYPAYVLSGLIAWLFFAQTTSAIIHSLVWGGEFFRRIYVPRSAFAISAIGTGLVNICLSLVPLIGVMLVIGVPIRATLLLIPLPIVILAFFALGFGLLIASIAIYFPDVVEMYNVILMAWMYFTPILYPLEILPDRVQVLMRFNPMFSIIRLFRLPIYEGKIPTFVEILPALSFTLVAFILGWWIFTKKSDDFAYRT